MVKGPEALFAERAVARVIQLAVAAQPGAEVVRLDGATAAAGSLAAACSPSLFDEDRVVVLDPVEQAGDAVIEELKAYLTQPAPDVVLILRHAGGPKARGIIDAVAAAGFPVVQCDAVTKDAQRSAFVSEEFARLGRKVAPAAVAALVGALGSDLRELASVCAQLAADAPAGVSISAALVERFQGGRIEASGFSVADAAIDGRSGDAVRMLRHALDVGVDPVPIVAALASRLRDLAKVAGTPGPAAATARTLAMAPWMVDRARRDLRRWTPDGLAAALSAVAAADAHIKGVGVAGVRHQPAFALEVAVLSVASAAE